MSTSLNGQMTISDVVISGVTVSKPFLIKSKFYLHHCSSIASSEFTSSVVKKKKNSNEIRFPDEFNIPICLEKYYNAQKEESFSDILGSAALSSVSPKKKKSKPKDSPRIELFVYQKKMFGSEEQMCMIKIIDEPFREIYDEFGKKNFLYSDVSKQFKSISLKIEYFSKEKRDKQEKEKIRVSTAEQEYIENIKNVYMRLTAKDLKQIFLMYDVKTLCIHRLVCRRWDMIIKNYEDYFKDYPHYTTIVFKVISNMLQASYRNFKDVKAVQLGLGEISTEFTGIVKEMFMKSRYHDVFDFVTHLFGKKFTDQHFIVDFKEPFCMTKIRFSTGSNLRVTIQDEFPVGNKVYDFRPTMYSEGVDKIIEYQNEQTFVENNPFTSLYFRFKKDNLVDEQNEIKKRRKQALFIISIHGFCCSSLSSIESTPVKYFLKKSETFFPTIPLWSKLFKRVKEIPFKMKVTDSIDKWYYKTRIIVTKDIWKIILEQFKKVNDEHMCGELLDTIEYFLATDSNQSTFRKAGGYNELLNLFYHDFVLNKDIKYGKKILQRFYDTFEDLVEDLDLLESIKERIDEL